MVVGSSTDSITTVKLMIEKKVVVESIPAKQALLVLLSSFYTFNMHYTEGCVNFYKALEVIFLKGKLDSKRVKLNRFLSSLDI